MDFQWNKEQTEKQTLRITKGQKEENHEGNNPDPKERKV